MLDGESRRRGSEPGKRCWLKGAAVGISARQCECATQIRLAAYTRCGINAFEHVGKAIRSPDGGRNQFREAEVLVGLCQRNCATVDMLRPSMLT